MKCVGSIINLLLYCMHVLVTRALLKSSIKVSLRKIREKNDVPQTIVMLQRISIIADAIPHS